MQSDQKEQKIYNRREQCVKKKLHALDEMRCRLNFFKKKSTLIDQKESMPLYPNGKHTPVSKSKACPCIKYFPSAL